MRYVALLIIAAAVLLLSEDGCRVRRAEVVAVADACELMREIARGIAEGSSLLAVIEGSGREAAMRLGVYSAFFDGGGRVRDNVRASLGTCPIALGGEDGERLRAYLGAFGRESSSVAAAEANAELEYYTSRHRALADGCERAVKVQRTLVAAALAVLVITFI